MKKYIFLGLLVVLPLGLIAILYGFGENRYDVDIYHPRWVEAVEIDGELYYDTLQDQPDFEKREIVDTLYHTIPSFDMLDQNGKPFTQKGVLGKIHVANFFFTRCGNPTLCPRMSEQMKRVQEKYKNYPEVELLSFSVDPEYDQPEVLQAYGEYYRANPEIWHFLTGEKTAIYDLAYHGYKVNAMEETPEVEPDFLHTTKFILVDKEGRIRGYYEGTDPEEIDRLINEIAVLQATYQ